MKRKKTRKIEVVFKFGAFYFSAYINILQAIMASIGYALKSNTFNISGCEGVLVDMLFANKGFDAK